jgi:3-oxoacyl-[acyl-carrier-protein] synthase II
MKKEIVITGIGVVAPNAIGHEKFLTALQEGISGIDEIRSFDSSEYLVHRGGEIKGLEEIQIRRDLLPGRTSQLAFVAISEALNNAGLIPNQIAPERIGVIVGSTSGEIQGIETVDECWALGKQDQLDSQIYTSFFTNIVSSQIASVFGFRGPVMMLSNACSSGNYAISLGCEMILNDQADVIVAGGADSFSKGALAGFSSVHAIAPEVCQPFDKNRKGMIVSEGSGFVILEERRHAEARSAKAEVIVLGSGVGCDAFHLTAPDPRGMANAMQNALKNAGVGVADLGYINAHGTGTIANDATETEAIKLVFGEAAYRIPVSSTKSMIGHTMGAASAIETIVCCLALKHDFLPPTINYRNADPVCDLDYVPNQARFQKVDVIMNNSFAFGGNNACVVLGRK